MYMCMCVCVITRVGSVVRVSRRASGAAPASVAGTSAAGAAPSAGAAA